MIKEWKNHLALAATFITLLPKLFFEYEQKIQLSLFIERDVTAAWFVWHYAHAIQFAVFTYLILFNRGLVMDVKRFIFAITCLDIVHLMLFAMRGYGVVKIGLAILIVMIWNGTMGRIINNTKDRIKRWRHGKV